MKRIFGYITMLTLAVACETMYGPVETPVAPDSAAGIEIAFSEVKDSSFTVTVTPAAEASYYSWVVYESPKAVALDSATLYSVGYKDGVTQGTAKWTAEATSTTFTVKKLVPNTTYHVYAVAGSKMGIAGSVAVKSVKTTDVLAPGYKEVESEENQVVFTFSEDVARNAEAGAIKVPYYAYYSAEFKTTAAAAGEVTVPEDSITVVGNQALISVPDLPTGCYWTITIPEGAFVDAVGQKLPAYASTFVMAEGKEGPAPTPKGFYGSVEYTELPMLGKMELKAFTEWDGGFVIPVESKYALAGFSSKSDKYITVTYKAEADNAVETVVYTLEPEADYNVTSLGLVVNLPAEPMCLGADVTITVPAGGIYDIFGNDSEEWSHTMKYSYGYTLKDIVGTYDWLQQGLVNGVSSTELVIAESNDAKKGNVMFTSYHGYDCSKNPIYANFNVDTGELTVETPQEFAYFEYEGVKYPIVFCSTVLDDEGYVEFEVGEEPVTFSVPESNVIAGPDWPYSIFLVDVVDGEYEVMDYIDFYVAVQGTIASDEDEAAPTALSSKFNQMKFKRF